MARFHTLCAPLITSPATPARVTDPRAQPPAAKELWPNFSQPKLLLSASESFSQRTFSFDLGRERVPVTERTDHGSSAGFGALLLSALGACLPLPERAWGAGCAGVAEALRLAVPLILRFVPGTAVPEASLPGPSGEAPRPGAGGRAAPGAGPNEWERDGRAGVAAAAAAAGGRPAHPGALRRGTAREPGAKVSWDKFRGGKHSCCCPGADGVEGSRHRLVSNPWAGDFLSQGSHTVFSRTCDSSSGGSAGFSAVRLRRPTLEEARVRDRCR